MSDSTLTEAIPRCLLDHRAVQAWSRLQPERVEPTGLELLKRKFKTAVYRMAGVGPAGAGVIAKRCRAVTATVERMIYEKFLAQLTLPALRLYGFVPEPDGEFCWLFLEDAGTDRYAPSSQAHRALVGRWLGAVHGTAFSEEWTQTLPQRGAGYYLGLVRRARAELTALAQHDVLVAEDLALLQKLASQCEGIEAHWEEAERCFEESPHGLVHGDLVIKNLRVRNGANPPALLIFDWEMAGWGVPATDLAQSVGRVASPDLEAYCEALRQAQPQCGVRHVQRLAHFGTLLRVIDKILWETIDPGGETYEFLLKPLMILRRYEPQLAAALRLLDWGEHD
ncbi:MAG TPA: phosphotransferase [Verrucomicrobiae bacterium]|nr:phosphotransferase [Verrucomicrobiae bacterium]